MLANRPKLYQMIGVEKGKFSDFDAWEKEYRKNLSDKNYLKETNDIYEQFYTMKSLLNTVTGSLKYKTISDVFIIPDEDELPEFGMLPGTKINQSSMYDHELLYIMIEAETLTKKAKAIKIPYIDLQGMQNKTDMEIAEATDYEIVARYDVEQFRHYSGNWARKYSSHPLNWFDKDLEFAYLWFRKMGLKVERKDLDRFLVIQYV